MIDWNVGFTWTVDVRGEYADVVTALGQRPTQTMDCENRSAVARGRQVGRYDVKNPQELREYIKPAVALAREACSRNFAGRVHQG